MVLQEFLDFEENLVWMTISSSFNHLLAVLTKTFYNCISLPIKLHQFIFHDSDWTLHVVGFISSHVTFITLTKTYKWIWFHPWQSTLNTTLNDSLSMAFGRSGFLLVCHLWHSNSSHLKYEVKALCYSYYICTLAMSRYVVLRIPPLVHLCQICIYLNTHNLERGDTVQVTMQKPYIKYKIISSSRSCHIYYKSFHYGKHEKF